eukprot:gene3070-5240_t
MSNGNNEGRYVVNSGTIIHGMLLYMIVMGGLKLAMPSVYSHYVYHKMEDFNSIRILGGCMLSIAWITWPFRLIGDPTWVRRIMRPQKMNDTIEKIKKEYKKLIKEQTEEEFGYLYVDPEDEDDLPWMEEFYFNEKTFEFRFNYDLTFEFDYDECIIKIPKDYPKGEYMIKRKRDGKFNQLLNRGDTFYDTLKNVFDDFYEIRMNGLDSTKFPDGNINYDEDLDDLDEEEIVEFSGDDFIKQTFLDEYDDWLENCPTSRRKLKGVSLGPPVIKIKEIETQMKLITFQIPGKGSKDFLEFSLYYADYLEEFGDHRLLITKYDEDLKGFISIIVSFLKNYDATEKKLTIKEILKKCSEIYQEAKKRSIKDGMKKIWYDRAADEIMETELLYKQLWAPILKNFISEEELSTCYDAKKNILKQLKKMKDMDCKSEGFKVSPFGKNIFLWRVDLFGFQKEYSTLQKDLETYANIYGATENITVEIYFTSKYPKEPPFVRVLKPRLVYLTGNVTFGGTFIEVPALGVTYSEHVDLISIIRSMRQTLINGGARVDMTVSQAYEKNTALRAYMRERRNVINGVGNFDKQMSVISINNARNSYGYSFIEPMHNIENANNICLPQSLRDKLKYGTSAGKVILELKTSDGKLFHCGVLDYTAKNNEIIVPNWMMKHLMLQEHSYIQVRTVKLPDCESIVFQPHSDDVYQSGNISLSIEQKLCHFIAITEGSTIPFVDDFTGKEFLLTVTQTEPSSGVCLFKGLGVVMELALSFAPSLDSKDNVVIVDKPDDEFVSESNLVDDDDWVEPDDEVIEEPENTSGALIGRRSDEETKSSNTTGSLFGKRLDTVTKIEKKETTKDSGTSTGGRSLSGTTDKVVDENSIKCEICNSVVTKNMFDIHTVHCKRRHGVK